MTRGDAQIESYQEYGFLSVDSVIGTHALTRFRDRIDTLVAEAASLKVNNEWFVVETGNGDDTPRINRIETPDNFYLKIREFIRDSVVIGGVSRLIEPYIRFNRGKLNMKSMGAEAPVEWHQDGAFYYHPNQHMLAGGLLFDDADEDNGALFVTPGSHKGPLYYHHIDGIFIGAINQAECDVDFLSAIPLVTMAGLITIYHTCLFYCSASDLLPRGRHLLVVKFVGADAWALNCFAGRPQRDRLSHRHRLNVASTAQGCDSHSIARGTRILAEYRRSVSPHLEEVVLRLARRRKER